MEQCGIEDIFRAACGRYGEIGTALREMDGRLLAAVVDSAYLVGEKGVKEAGAKVLHPLIGRRAVLHHNDTVSVGRTTLRFEQRETELGDDGASFRRPVLRTPFSNPPATLLGSDLALRRIGPKLARRSRIILCGNFTTLRA